MNWRQSCTRQQRWRCVECRTECHYWSLACCPQINGDADQLALEQVIYVLRVFDKAFWAKDRPMWYAKRQRQAIWLHLADTDDLAAIAKELFYLRHRTDILERPWVFRGGRCQAADKSSSATAPVWPWSTAQIMSFMTQQLFQ